MQPRPRPESLGGPYVGYGVGLSFAATAPEPGRPEAGMTGSSGDLTPAGSAAGPAVPTAGRRHRLVAAATAMLGGAVLTGAAFAGAVPYAIAMLAVQLALVGTWCLVTRPPGMIGTLVVGALTALGADAVALSSGESGAGGLVTILACAFGAATITQLARGVTRRNVTESFGTTLAVAVAVIALASTVALRGVEGGHLVGLIVLCACGGIGVARLADLVLPRPNAHPSVHRGIVGLGLGSAGAAALCVPLYADRPLGPATLVGWLVGTAAVLGDLGVDYARAGRLAAGTTATGGAAGAALGPLVALAVAAPVGYLLAFTL